MTEVKEYETQVIMEETKEEAKGGEDDDKNNKAILNSVGFVLGFTIVFLILSIFASQLGSILSSNIRYIKIIFGIVIILFGLNYMDLLKIKFLNKSNMKNLNTKNFNFYKAILFDKFNFLLISFNSIYIIIQLFTCKN